jgi:hypothetical protein
MAQSTIELTMAKQRAAELVQTIRENRPLQPDGGQWTGRECLIAAGALVAAAAEILSPESRLDTKWMIRDLQAAIDFYGTLVMAEATGNWDQVYEGTVSAGVADGAFLPLKGFKNMPTPA